MAANGTGTRPQEAPSEPLRARTGAFATAGKGQPPHRLAHGLMSSAPSLSESLADNRTLGHTTPCAECPFRKKSLRGYLGGYSLHEYSYPPSVGVPTTCHCRDEGMSNPRTKFCAGSCAVIANDPEVFHPAEYEEAIRGVGKRDDCFPSVQAFEEYHDEMNARMMSRS